MEPCGPVRIAYHPVPHFVGEIVHMRPRCVDFARFLSPDNSPRIQKQNGPWGGDIILFDDKGLQALNGHTVTSVRLALELTMFDKPPEHAQRLSAWVINSQF